MKTKSDAKVKWYYELKNELDNLLSDIHLKKSYLISQTITKDIIYEKWIVSTKKGYQSIIIYGMYNLAQTYSQVFISQDLADRIKK
ncbi:MAG: hypothetical protein WD876_03675 [Candidatus Pacearchaeota archaeon]